MEGSGNNLEASRAQLTEFNSALYNFMENMNNKDSKQSIFDMNDFYSKVHGSEGSFQFDLNSKCRYDLVFAGGGGIEIEAKMLSYML
ncbi:hypothetical protein AHAS_Ahas12G0216100 [Arachis hypogaea]